MWRMKFYRRKISNYMLDVKGAGINLNASSIGIITICINDYEF